MYGKERIFPLRYNNNITNDFKSQVEKILQKAQIKKSYNKFVIDWLESVGNIKKADIIRQCATMIGVTDVSGVAHVTRANFCRERVCSVCAWRRQSKFVAQMLPVLEALTKQNYEFIFVTLSMRNVTYDCLDGAIDNLMKAYDRFLHLRKVKRSWVGKVRSVELTYNETANTFHPHLHILVAVTSDYFHSEDYITLSELICFWRNCLQVDYDPSVDISKVNDEYIGAVETLKYAFKPSFSPNALSGFYYVLKNRRLVSFSGVFAEQRKLFKFSSFEDILTDDLPLADNKKFTCFLYKFDSTGGIYNYYNTLECEK